MRVYCNIHPQMVGFVMVVDSDFVAVTGPDGSFRFDRRPAGHRTSSRPGTRRAARSSQPVDGQAGAGDAPLAIRIDVSGFKAEPHKNKYGKDYAPARRHATMSATEAPPARGADLGRAARSRA